MSERLDQAIAFATASHAGQVRKLAGSPYILHPLEVCTIASTLTNDEDILIAALLHDTVEDCSVDPREIRLRFGPRVAALVQSESEDKLSDRPPADTWMERKEESLLMLEHTKDTGTRILWLSDKLSNIRSFYREQLKSGDAIWQALNQKDPQMHRWYYQTVADYLTEFKGQAAYEEYTMLIEKTFGGKK